MPAEKPRRALGYARVSSVEQSFGQSLQEQQASISAYAKARGLTLERTLVEAESGGREKLEHREQMQVLLREARRGDLVLVDKLDRWSRDPEFTYRSVRELLSRGVSMYVVSEEIDPSTNDGDTKLNFRVLFAREEHKRIRERTHGVRSSLRKQGYFVEGAVPFGYRKAVAKTHRDIERHVLVVYPPEAKIVEKAFRMVARGVAIADIAEEFGLTQQRVRRFIHNRHYLGEMRLSKGGEWVKGKHPAIVSASLFARAESTVSGRLLGPRRDEETALTKDWIVKDVARCVYCGGAMVSAYGKGSNGAYTYFYYRCWSRCRSNYVPVREVEALVVDLVAAQLIELKNELATGPEPTVESGVDFAAKRAAIERRRTKHIEAHADETITLGDLRAALAKLDIERQKIDAAESAAGVSQRTRDPSVRRGVLRDVRALESRWRGADPRTQREIVNQLAKQIRIAKNPARRLVVEPDWRSIEELAEDLGR